MSTDPADGPSDRSESPVATEPLRRERAEPPSAVVVQDLGPALHDYGDAALALDALDLLIGDTSVVHLAGALGKPVWLLLSDVPDYTWDWKARRRPGFRASVFSASRPWTGVIARMVEALAHWANAKGHLEFADPASYHRSAREQRERPIGRSAARLEKGY